MIFLVTIEILMAFLVICSETIYVQTQRQRGTPVHPLSRLTQLRHGIFWLWTIGTWVYRGRNEDVIHFGGYLWSALLTSWLWRMIYFTVERQHWPNGDVIYLIILYGVMFFVTVSLNMHPWIRGKDTRNNFSRILIKGVFWMITIPRWFKSGDFEIVKLYLVAFWLLTPMSWLFSDSHDAIKQISKALTQVF